MSADDLYKWLEHHGPATRAQMTAAGFTSSGSLYSLQRKGLVRIQTGVNPHRRRGAPLHTNFYVPTSIVCPHCKRHVPLTR